MIRRWAFLAGEGAMYDLEMPKGISAKRVLKSVESPVGLLTIVASNTGLHALLFGNETVACAAGFKDSIEDPDHPVLLQAERELREYFQRKRKKFDVQLNLAGTPFQRQVWNMLREIPYGKTTTYGELAARMGSARLARAVGAANGRNPVAIIVPCHRVIGKGGALTGFGGGLDTKSFLLDLERPFLA
jgi:methylated-DNA-[protein]-cysteine S-methyltransferase